MQMGTSVAVYVLVIAAVVLASLYVLVRKRSAKSRKTVVVCPPKQITAELQINAAGQIVGCTRLPPGHTCDQACHAQAAYSGTDLEEFAARTEGQPCSNCGTKITREDWYQSRSAAAASAGNIVKIDSRTLCWKCSSKA